MNLKTISIAVGALAVLALLVSLTQRPPQWESDDPLVGQTLLDRELARDVRALEIEGRDEEPVRIQLSDTGRWVLPRSHNTPADFDRLNRLVASLSEAEVARKVTERADRMERLDLERYRLSLHGEENQTLASMQIGKSGSSGGSFVKLNGSAAAYLASESIFLDATPGYWEDKTPVELEAKSVKAVSIPLDGESGGFLLASRESPEQPFANPGLAQDEQLKADEVESLIGNLTDLRFTTAVDREDADAREAWEHRRKFVLEPFEGSPFNLYVGRRPEEVIPAEITEPEATPGTPPGGTEEPETETIPAGDPFLFLEFAEDDTHPWAEPGRHYAFQISSFNFERLETSRDTYVSVVEEAVEAEGPDPASE
jgi:hypothetical protein